MDARVAPVAPLPRFDPRQVPVVAVDTQLPAVPLQQLQPTALRRRFASPPIWLPETRIELPFSRRGATRAAVLIALVNRPGGLSVLLTQRTDFLPTHSGQVAFPGGKVDATDRGVQDTALREAHEEIGLAPARVNVLGKLPLYVTGSRFVITPVVALVSGTSALHPNPDEVADVFEVPLSFLMNPAHHRHHRLQWDGHVREWLSMPYPDDVQRAGGGPVVERFIWGATAGMLRNLYRFLVA
ncbi:MAG: CoA pyrophosphatase [Ottowia sp.]|nr:CoA pyrophosphatase [Ottowia sp.]